MTRGLGSIGSIRSKDLVRTESAASLNFPHVGTVDSVSFGSKAELVETRPMVLQVAIPRWVSSLKNAKP